MADGIEVEQIMESRPKKVNILHHKTLFFGFLFSALKLHSASFLWYVCGYFLKIMLLTVDAKKKSKDGREIFVEISMMK